MRIYRITKERYLTDFSGLGGSFKNGGRWNKAGTPVLYFALNPGAAMLEMAHYTSSPRLVPPSTRIGTYEIPDDAPIVKILTKDIPADWSDFPYPTSTQQIGDAWLQANKGFGFVVPTCAMPGMFEMASMVVNPKHDIITGGQIKLVDSSSQIFNPRAFPGVG